MEVENLSCEQSCCLYTNPINTFVYGHRLRHVFAGVYKLTWSVIVSEDIITTAEVVYVTRYPLFRYFDWL